MNLTPCCRHSSIERSKETFEHTENVPTMARIERITEWLSPTVRQSSDGRYRHQLLIEDALKWNDLQTPVKHYFRTAHADAVRRLRKLAGISLHPFRASESKTDPSRNYPHSFGMTVLKGYFGEVIGLVLAESYAPCGVGDWEVPCFLFRYHLIAFQQLEIGNLGGTPSTTIPGRTGDDCLAFRRDRAGKIVAVLYCEAKCSASHDSSLVAEAHEKVSQPGPVDILQMIEVLQDCDSPEAEKWIIGLRQFRETLLAGKADRRNLVCYVCGKRPVQRETWLPTDRPHNAYTSPGRYLEAIEVHLANVEATINAVYSSEGWL
jgi:hypothetical protein